MNRKQFILSKGATCANWNWSWSFVNHEERFVIFGAWDELTTGDMSVILKEQWERARGRKMPGYTQGIEHVRLIEEEEYSLFTFPMERDKSSSDDVDGAAKIGGFKPVLSERTLVRVGDIYYALDANTESGLPEEVIAPQRFVEGVYVVRTFWTDCSVI